MNRRAMKWCGFLGVALGALVAMQSLGFAMPWNALSKTEAADIYETKEHARAMFRNIEDQQRIMLDMDKKLDKLLLRK